MLCVTQQNDCMLLADFVHVYGNLERPLTLFEIGDSQVLKIFISSKPLEHRSASTRDSCKICATKLVLSTGRDKTTTTFLQVVFVDK